MTNGEQSAVVEQLLVRAREGGFPHFSMTRAERLCAFSELTAFDRTKLLRGTAVAPSNHGMGLCWQYHPHHWSVKCAGARTAVDTWNDDDKLRKAIHNAITQPYFKWSHSRDERGPYLAPSHLRAAIRRANSVQRVSNFRPTAAAIVYDLFCKGAVWDPCAGFGGRMLGAIASNAVSRYVACEPSTQTFRGLRRMAGDLAHVTSTKCELFKTPAEEYTPEQSAFSLVFTSPPYGRTEIFSHEKTQSCNRYKTVMQWTYGFLRPIVERARHALEPGGAMAINVANTRQHPTIVVDVVDVAAEFGFHQIDSMSILMSSVRKGGWKSEPLLLFRKS